MIWLQHIPVLLASLLMAAHFLRAESMLLVLVSLGMPLILLFPGRRVARIYQGYLLCGVVTWIWTAFEIAGERMARSEPWVRMAVILGSVALFTLFAAALFETPRMRRRYRAESPHPPS